MSTLVERLRQIGDGDGTAAKRWNVELEAADRIVALEADNRKLMFTIEAVEPQLNRLEAENATLKQERDAFKQDAIDRAADCFEAGVKHEAVTAERARLRTEEGG